MKARGPRNFIRFCFAKRDEVLDEALNRLRAHAARSAA